MQPQLVMEKLCFLQDLLEPRDLPSFNAVKITRQTSLNQARKDKRRLKNIFNHFRDKPARHTVLAVLENDLRVLAHIMFRV
jgi:hypothetical protein